MTCPHCRRWREEADEAREALRQAGEARAGRAASIAAEAGLTPAQARLVEALLAAPDVAGYEMLEARLGRSRAWVKVVAFQVRMRAPWIGIVAVRGHGWRLAPASRAELARRLEALP